MDERDEAVAWVRARFNEPDTNAVDARLLDRIATDPDAAVQLRRMMTAPQEGTLHRVDIGPASESALAKPLELDSLNARLGLIGVRAVPFQREAPRLTETLWVVRVPGSHVDVVRFLLAGLYGLSYGPDGDAVAPNLRGLDDTELQALRLCFGEVMRQVRDARQRLQEADMPRISAPNLVHFSVRMPMSFLDGALNQLAAIDEVVADEQRRRRVPG